LDPAKAVAALADARLAAIVEEDSQDGVARGIAQHADDSDERASVHRAFECALTIAAYTVPKLDELLPHRWALAYWSPTSLTRRNS